MYSFFNKISVFISEPFVNAANTDIAFIAAMFLGFVGSVAPCQMSANVAAITYFGQRQARAKLSWLETIMYLLGKMVVFSIFGALFWFFGQKISTEMIPLYSFSRKLLGPLLILVGIFLIGLIRIRLPLQFGARVVHFFEKIADRSRGRSEAFLMGFAFSLGFCPTMLVLFFGSLMPLALQSDYGVVLPSVFAIGTAMPFLLIAGLIIIFGLDRVILKHAKRWGLWVQKLAGILLIVLGISDTLTFWNLL